jgi:hypothetical protein
MIPKPPEREAHVMLKHIVVVGLAIGLVGACISILPAYGQKSTEVFIPIGQSPGVSGKLSVIGEIRSIDRAMGLVTIRGEEAEHSAKITDKTKIWLDRSAMKKSSLRGSLTDCRKGLRCEIKYAYDGATRTDVAEWIKIQVSDSD